MAAPRVAIQTDDFDLGAEVAALRAGDGGVGAVAAFVGTVRDRNDGAPVASLELEHYPGMTEEAIEAMIDEAMRRFDIRAARVVHRVGVLAADRPDRAGRRHLGAPRRGVPGLRVPDGLPEDPGAVLEEGSRAGRRALGRCARRRRRGAGALGHRRRQRGRPGRRRAGAALSVPWLDIAAVSAGAVVGLAPALVRRSLAERALGRLYLNCGIFDQENLRAEFSELIAYSADFAPAEIGDGETCTSFFWKNSQFGYSDAMSYYAYIKRIRPKTVLEIGSGFSSLIAVEALRKNGSGKLSCIEPFPDDSLRH